MRSILLQLSAAIVLGLVPSLGALAQSTYWGMTSTGGSGGIGTIYTMNEAGVFAKRHDFMRVDGGRPRSELVKWTNGHLYGVTALAGANGVGVVFSYDPGTGTYLVRAHFTTGTTGEGPIGGLCLAGNNRMYGVCARGGTNGFGTLFEFDPATNGLVTKVHFAGTSNGREPNCRLVLDGNHVWGTTFQGGANGTGCIFQYGPVNGSAAMSRRFSFGALAGNTTGRSPRFGLARTTNGKLIGVAQAGGAGGFGTVYQIGTASPYTYTVIQDLSAATGTRPAWGGLVEGPTANILYGTTTEGGANGVGSVYQVNASAAVATFTKVHDITSGGIPNVNARMTKGANGLLYGTSLSGGTGGNGVFFSFNTTNNTPTVLAPLAPAGLSASYGAVIEEGGQFYGLTEYGGSADAGALYRVNATGTTFQTLVSFSASDGASPHGRLLAASNGLYYGLTYNGGGAGAGSLFSFDPTTSTFTKRQDLGPAVGRFPEGTLVEVSGKLYGLCAFGGANDAGTIIEYDLATNALVKKVDLSSSTGTNPVGGFTVAANGSLYTTARSGGANGAGTLIRYAAGATSVTVLHNFAPATTGQSPHGRLMQAANGLIYGTTWAGGQFGSGTLFSFNTSSNATTLLYAFDGLQGGDPLGEILQASNGKLYGMCSDEGLYQFGCIYSWNPTSGTYTEEYDMNADEGKHSSSSLIQGVDGNLYGTCKEGGPSVEMGTIFRFNPTTAVYTRLRTFDATAGYYPYDGFTREGTVAPVAQVLLAPKVFLEGPYVQATGLMNHALRTLPTFPTTEPYTGLGFTQVGGGGETISPSVLAVSGNNAIVDWVLVELRNATTPSTIVATKAALLQSDGDVVGLDGTSAVSIAAASGVNYHVAVRHRNHLGVMTASAVALNSSSSTALNFTTSGLTVHGTNALKTVGSARVCWAGNARRDNLLRYTGSNNDRDPILTRVGGSVPTATANGYFTEDTTLDGVVRYNGNGNDRDVILSNVGGSVPTATRTEQLP